MKKIDLNGCVFGKLKVITEAKKRETGGVYWICGCECGKEIETTTANLRSGNSKSCGCVAIAKTVKRNTTHGHSKRGKHEPEFDVWQSMIDRCYNFKNKKYIRYGARGIGVCKRWLNSYINFFSDMGKRPVGSGRPREYSLERKDNDKWYKKSNCKWGTQEEQSRNRGDNHWIEHEGKKMILQDWAKLLKASHSNIIRMLRNRTFQEVYNHYMKCA